MSAGERGSPPMGSFPVFLSVVFVVRNQGAKLGDLISHAVGVVTDLVSDYELIVVDNSSDDDSVAVLRAITSESG